MDQSEQRTRKMVDILGFTTTSEQMDKLMERIQESTSKDFKKEYLQQNENNPTWRTAICPHDDYIYAGYLYPELLKNVRAKTLILIGVAHQKARALKAEDCFMVDSYPYWHGPYGNVKISGLREDILNDLPKDIYQVNDAVHEIEHSIEALIPFLQYFNRDIEVFPLIVSAMSYERMQHITKLLAETIAKIAEKKKWEWGKDYAIVISNDAVHYGDEGWGGKNFAFFGNDSAAHEQAVKYEHTIIDECLKDEITPEKVKAFIGHTCQKENYREYKWTWCGRFPVSCGLLTSYYLQECLKVKPLKGKLVSYSSSIDGKHLAVEDLGMGTHMPAKLSHWVGYASIGYE